MAWDDVLRSGIATAASVLGDGLLAAVTHEPYLSQNAYGEPVYGAGVARTAVVTDEDTLIRDKDGQEIVAHTRILFLADVSVDTRDRLTRPGGRTSPILRVDYGVRAHDGGAFTTEVWC